MKEDELRQHTSCTLCSTPLGKTRFPRFFVVTIETYLLDLKALQRHQGLTMQLSGHAELARIMGPNEDLAHKLGEPAKLTVCENCAIDTPWLVFSMLEAADRKEEAVGE